MSEGKEVNTTLKNNIEAIILKWSYQVWFGNGVIMLLIFT